MPSHQPMLDMDMTADQAASTAWEHSMKAMSPLEIYQAQEARFVLKSIGIDCLFLPRMQALLLRRPYFFQALTQPIELPEHPPSLTQAAYLWTSKEAIAKALKTGVWQQGIDWKDLLVLDHGQVQLLNQAKILLGEAQLTLQFQIKGDYAFAKASLWQEKS